MTAIVQLKDAIDAFIQPIMLMKLLITTERNFRTI